MVKHRVVRVLDAARQRGGIVNVGRLKVGGGGARSVSAITMCLMYLIAKVDEIFIVHDGQNVVVDVMQRGRCGGVAASVLGSVWWWLRDVLLVRRWLLLLLLLDAYVFVALANVVGQEILTRVAAIRMVH